MKDKIKPIILERIKMNGIAKSKPSAILILNIIGRYQINKPSIIPQMNKPRMSFPIQFTAICGGLLPSKSIHNSPVTPNALQYIIFTILSSRFEDGGGERNRSGIPATRKLKRTPIIRC